MTLETFFQNCLNDLKVELYEEFTENFRLKAFFDRAWPAAKMPPKRGSLMVRHSGGLKDSIYAHIQGSSIHFTSPKPYASIHNEGGEITVTTQSCDLPAWTADRLSKFLVTWLQHNGAARRHPGVVVVICFQNFW